MKHLKRLLTSGVAMALAIIFSNTAYGIGPYTDNGLTVTDTATGLEWQQADDGIERTWQESLSYCENLSLDSRDDWRLPNFRELDSIVDFSVFNPSIDPAFSCRSSYYWSSTSKWSNAWNINFLDGSDYYFTKNSIRYIRCVRAGLLVEEFPISLPRTGQITSYAYGDDGDIEAGTIWPNPRFTDNMDGTVADNLTDLMWTKDADLAGTITWQGALDYVASLNSSVYLGHSDWRLPNINELRSLIDAERKNPALPAGHPFSNITISNYYWSSTTYIINPPHLHALSMRISDGSLPYWDKIHSSNMYVWPVRSVQNGIIQLPKTGQTKCYDTSGAEITCAGTEQDGDLQIGTPWPNPRFLDNGDGTVTDNLNDLIWTLNANLPLGSMMTWQNALDYVAGMNAGTYQNFGFADWRMPNRQEIASIKDAERYNPALPVGYPFTNVQNSSYWSSTTHSVYTSSAWRVTVNSSYDSSFYQKTGIAGYIWPVRGGTIATEIHTITASAGSNGTISPSGTVAVYHGSNQAFIITPDANYHVADVLVDSSSVGVVTSHIFNNVTSDRTIAASFAIDDNCPGDPNKTEPGICGCGVADTDTDNDGTPDCNDIFPDDPTETTDTDDDGVGDNSDNCTTVANASQDDSNSNSVGDVCDPEVPVTSCSADSQNTGTVGWITSKACGEYKVIHPRQVNDAGVETAVTIDYMVHTPDGIPKAMVVLLEGGSGDVAIEGDSSTGEITNHTWNVFARSAQLFADRGYLAVTLDKPYVSDTYISPYTTYDGYRLSMAQGVDIASVIAAENTSNLDVLLVGMSRGGISSVAQYQLGTAINVTSPVTVDHPVPDTWETWVGASDLPPEDVTVPVHFLIHQDDGCILSPPANAPSVFGRFTGLDTAYTAAGAANSLAPAITGGFEVSPNPCYAATFHGYLGVENAAVDSIAHWMDGVLTALDTTYTGNNRPAAPPVTSSTYSDIALTIDLSSLASDLDIGDTLIYSLLHGSSARGAALAISDSAVTYTPSSANIEDTFVYVVSDGKGGTSSNIIVVNVGDPAPDTDGDGIPNVNDADDDNDGVNDVSDLNPLNPDICGDADIDTCDDCSVGTDNFGILADYLPGNDGADTDGDGSCDAGDICPNDPFDMLNDCSTCGPAPTEICDGIDNNCDGQVDEGVTNVCGTCGIPADADNDGTPDCDDECPNDPNKIAAGYGGCGYTDDTVNTGTGVTVSPVPEVDVSFDSISTPCNLAVTQIAVTLPAGYKTVGSAAYDINSDCAETNTEVCLSYNEGDVTTTENDLMIFHYDGSSWVDISDSIDTTNNFICGSTPSFSPFAVAEEDSDIATPPTTTKVPVHNGFWLILSVLTGLYLLRRRKDLSA